MSYKRLKFPREYFGLIPLTGAAITAGAVGGAAFLITLASEISKQAYYIGNGGSIVDAISAMYQHAGNVAGQWIMPAGAVGQFLAYRFKKSVLSIFKK
jgi:hypothetical protein